jgi:hypothetical protein
MNTDEINKLISDTITGESKDYTGDVGAAIGLLQLLHKKEGVTINYSNPHYDNEPSWFVQFSFSGPYWAANDSLPIAICLAALRKAGVKFTNEEYKPHYWRNRK